jgi:hypothetical protein
LIVSVDRQVTAGRFGDHSLGSWLSATVTPGKALGLETICDGVRS